MIYHQLNVFLQDFSNSFHCWFNFYILLYSGASIILGSVSRCHSHLLKTEEKFPFNLAPFSSRFVILVCCHPLVIVLIVRIFFTHPEQFKILFSLFLRSPSSQNLFILSFQLWFSKSYRCFVQVISNQSWSLRSRVSNFSQTSSFIC